VYTRIVRFLPISALCAALALGQSATADRHKAGDYPVSTSLLREDLGAEFLVHSVPATGGYYYAKGYLVVDVGVFPKPGVRVAVSSGQFILRVNGGNGLTAQAPGAVAGALKYPDWNGRPTGLDIGGSVGNVGISSAPPPVPRFPNDPRVPAPPGGRATSSDDDVDSRIEAVALPDVVTRQPLKGCLFFASDIKPKKIKSLELEWTGPEREHAVLKLK